MAINDDNFIQQLVDRLMKHMEQAKESDGQ